MKKPNRTAQGVENQKKAKAAWKEHNREKLRLQAKAHHVLNREYRNAQERAAYRANPERWYAHLQVRRALQRGALVKRPCSDCGSLNVHGHHEDYSKPLDVIWLCKSCHQKLHNSGDHKLA